MTKAKDNLLKLEGETVIGVRVQTPPEQLSQRDEKDFPSYPLSNYTEIVLRCKSGRLFVLTPSNFYYKHLLLEKIDGDISILLNTPVQFVATHQSKVFIEEQVDIVQQHIIFKTQRGTITFTWSGRMDHPEELVDRLVSGLLYSETEY